MKYLVITVAACAILSGCAKRPDAIVPTTIPMQAYTPMSCAKLNAELAREQQNLTTLSNAQNSAATGDAVGVFLIGVPMSSVAGGDKEGEIAVSKGKIQAMNAAKLRNQCN